LHYPEQLSKEQVYEFAYFETTNKIKGMAAGVAMPPVAIY